MSDTITFVPADEDANAVVFNVLDREVVIKSTGTTFPVYGDSVAVGEDADGEHIEERVPNPLVEAIRTHPAVKVGKRSEEKVETVLARLDKASTVELAELVAHDSRKTVREAAQKELDGRDGSGDDSN